MNPCSKNITGVFVNEDSSDRSIWIKESPSTGEGYKGKYAFEMTDIYGFQELPEDLWEKAYWHGHKIIGAYVRDYSSDSSYVDVTIIFWLGNGYVEYKDALPTVEQYSFSIDAEDNNNG